MTPTKVNPRSLFGWKICLAVAIALLLSWLSPRAQADSRFDVFLGFDSMLPDHGWFPITCEVQNDGPSYNAIIEVTTAQQIGGPQIRRVQVDLPKGTLKRVVIPVFTAASYWNVRLLDEHNKVRAEQTMMQAKVMPPDLPLVAGLCRTVQGLPTFPEMPSRYQNASTPMSYRAARLEPALFPDNPLAMDSIDLLYLNSQKALELSEPQAAAVMAWLQSGGHLVVGVEQISDITGSRWLQSLMPCDLTSAGNLTDHAALEEWVRNARIGTPARPPARGPIVLPLQGSRDPRRSSPPRPTNAVQPSTLVPQAVEDDATFDSAPLPILTGSLRDGSVLIGSSDAPLAITADRGRGKITVLTFSPEREPFLSWNNRGFFWAKLAAIPRERMQAGSPAAASLGHLASDGIFGAMIDSKQVRKLPLSWLLLLLVAYLAVIGPLDQYWLKKLNRQMLTWITFPLYVVAFSGLIYFIGFHLRAGELEWNELNIVDVLPGTERAVLRGETYVSIYSPVNAHYALDSQQPYATLRGESSANYNGAHESSEVSVLQTGNNFHAEASVPVWTSQLFVSDWLQGNPVAPLEMTASRTSSGDWSVSIVNNTESDLAHAKVVLGGHIHDVGPLLAHQTKSTNINNTSGSTVTAFANQYMNAFRTAVNQRHQSFGNNNAPIGDTIEGSMAACFLSLGDFQNPQQGMNYNGMNEEFALNRNLDLGRFADRDHTLDHAILLAWYPEHSLVDGLNHFQAKHTHRDTLLRLVIPVTTSGPASANVNKPQT